MLGAICRPLRVWPTAHMSSHEELVQEPTMTWSMAVPATSRAGTTLSGEEREVAARRLVRGEDARGQRQLGAHVADGRALGQGERGGARARVLEDLPAAAPHAVAPQQL